jgi:UDP-glucuronate decarboxylase
MKLLLSGGTGFFGKSLLRHWTSQAELGLPVPQVCILSRSPDAFLKLCPEFRSHAWLSFSQGNVLRPDSLPSGDFTHILHAATDSTMGPKLSPLERYHQIVDGTRNLLDYAVTHQARRFLLTSSGGVYGPQPESMAQIPESYTGMSDPLQAQNAYGVAKRCAEHLCALYRDRYGLETVVARCFAFVGRDLPLDVHFAIGNFIRDAIAKPDITVSGDGTAIRSYMDQRDLAHWLNKLLACGQAGQAYNVGSDQAITIHELAHLVRDSIAPKKSVRIIGLGSEQNFRNRYVPSIYKAQSELGLCLNFPLETSIQETTRFAIINKKYEKTVHHF